MNNIKTYFAIALILVLVSGGIWNRIYNTADEQPLARHAAEPANQYQPDEIWPAQPISKPEPAITASDSTAAVTDREINERMYVLRAWRDPADTTPCTQVTLYDGSQLLCWEDYGMHPYMQYHPDALVPLAHDDAVAAAALARIIYGESPFEAYYFARRSSELSGKPGPLLGWLSIYSGGLSDRTIALETVAIAELVDRDYDVPYSVAELYRTSVRSAHSLTDREIDNEIVALAGGLQ
ncbi:MAG: hypothetical protein AAFN50_04490 [Pseudomonadota bacterium]